MILVPALFIATLTGAAVLYHQKDEIVNDFKDFLASRLWKVFGLRIRFESVGGNLLLGSLAFHGVSAYSPAGDSQELLFKAREIDFQYGAAEIFMKNFSAWAQVVLKEPVFYADVPFTPRARPGSRQNMEVFSRLVSKVKKNTQFVIENGTISWLGHEGALSGIHGTIENRQFYVEVSLNHIPAGKTDLSTRLLVNGRLETAPQSGEDRLAGMFHTQGTIVNWKPVPQESRVSYVLTKDALQVKDSSFFGGIRMRGRFFYQETPQMEITVSTKDYALDNLNVLLSAAHDKTLSGRTDVQIALSGSMLQPAIQANVLIKDSRMGDRQIKNLQLNAQGVWPEVRVSESRMLLEDGTLMALADGTVQVSELLNSKTYERLVTQTDQESVAWGDWHLKRTDASDSVSLEKDMGQLMKVHYERYGRDEATIQPQDQPDEVGLEYRLTGSDSVMMEIRENEEKVMGVQKKVSF